MNILYNFNTADASRPSFFEMYIQTQMMPSLKPALKYILAVASQRFPRFQTASRYSDELFYAALFVLERHYLRHYDGSFAENFYGLKRARAAVGEDGKAPPLSRRDKLWSLFFLVAMPYLKDKLDRWYNTNYAHNSALVVAGEFDLPDNVDAHRTNVAARNRHWRKLIQLVYPIATAAFEGLIFLYQLFYMYQHTQFFTPFLHAQGLIVKRLSMQDVVIQTHRASKRYRNYTGLSQVWFLATEAWHTLLDYSKYILPMAIFFFKFLEWWYTENRFVSPTQPIPPPPSVPKIAVGGLPVPQDRKICPICNNVRVNSAMSAGGFVFCYSCIFAYVNTHGRCPITFVPNTPEQIRKIYDENES